MTIIRLEPTQLNRYLKQAFDHIRRYHYATEFGYDEIPDPDPEVVALVRRTTSSDAIFLGSDSTAVKSHIMVVMKSMGLRESVSAGTFRLTDRARLTLMECDGEVTPQIDDEIIAFIEQGKHGSAVELARDHYGMSIEKANQFVESLSTPPEPLKPTTE